MIWFSRKMVENVPAPAPMTMSNPCSHLFVDATNLRRYTFLLTNLLFCGKG